MLWLGSRGARHGTFDACMAGGEGGAVSREGCVCVCACACLLALLTLRHASTSGCGCLCASMASAWWPALKPGCLRVASPSPSPLQFTHSFTREHTKISAREEAIAIEMVKNLREKVSWCQREHPVTHYYDCADIVGKYLKLVKVREKEEGREGREGRR